MSLQNKRNPATRQDPRKPRGRVAAAQDRTADACFWPPASSGALSSSVDRLPNQRALPGRRLRSKLLGGRHPCARRQSRQRIRAAWQWKATPARKSQARFRRWRRSPIGTSSSSTPRNGHESNREMVRHGQRSAGATSSCVSSVRGWTPQRKQFSSRPRISWHGKTWDNSTWPCNGPRKLSLPFSGQLRSMTGTSSAWFRKGY